MTVSCLSAWVNILGHHFQESHRPSVSLSFPIDIDAKHVGLLTPDARGPVARTLVLLLATVVTCSTDSTITVCKWRLESGNGHFRVHWLFPGDCRCAPGRVCTEDCRLTWGQRGGFTALKLRCVVDEMIVIIVRGRWEGIRPRRVTKRWPSAHYDLARYSLSVLSAKRTIIRKVRRTNQHACDKAGRKAPFSREISLPMVGVLMAGV